jgi:hypothetical protein
MLLQQHAGLASALEGLSQDRDAREAILLIHSTRKWLPFFFLFSKHSMYLLVNFKII